MSPERLGKQYGLVVRNIVKGLLGEWRVLGSPPNASCLQRFWGVLFLSEGLGFDVE